MWSLSLSFRHLLSTFNNSKIYKSFLCRFNEVHVIIIYICSPYRFLLLFSSYHFIKIYILSSISFYFTNWFIKINLILVLTIKCVSVRGNIFILYCFSYCFTTTTSHSWHFNKAMLILWKCCFITANLWSFKLFFLFLINLLLFLKLFKFYCIFIYSNNLILFIIIINSFFQHLI